MTSYSPHQKKSAKWCGTEVSFNQNEADQTPFNNHSNNDSMATIIEDKRYYPCVTQDGYMPTFGQLQDPPTGSSHHHGDSIMVGNKELIPRWTASPNSPTKLLYFVIREGFANDADFQYAAKSFQDAAAEWNALAFGVTISPTTEQAKANFRVKYFKPAVDKGTIASAFFPNDVKDVLVYDKTLVEKFWRDCLKNSFLHEIGHIIGLRHEFANDPNPEDGNQPFESVAHRFGSVNPHSVMSYDDINYINEMDKKDVKEFYKLANRSKINGVEIKDFDPKPFQPKN